MVAIFGADHIYRMNIREMVEFHVERGAQVTVSAIPVEKEQASEFGVIETKEDGLIIGFHEKKPDAPTMPGDPESRVRVHGELSFHHQAAAGGAARRRRRTSTAPTISAATSCRA